jgi:hypothetical protein
VNRRLRRAHRAVFTTLACALPALWVAAWWDRPDAGAADELVQRERAGAAVAAVGGLRIFREDALGRLDALLGPGSVPGTWRVLGAGATTYPDVLVYREDAPPAAGDAPLAAEAQLAGSLLELERTGRDLRGPLAFFSLGHGRTVGRAPAAPAGGSPWE